MSLPVLKQLQTNELQWLRFLTTTMLNNLRQVFEYHRASGRMDRGVAMWVMDQVASAVKDTDRSESDEKQGRMKGAMKSMKRAYATLIRAESLFYVSRTPLWSIDAARSIMDWKYRRYLGQIYTG